MKLNFIETTSTQRQFIATVSKLGSLYLNVYTVDKLKLNDTMAFKLAYDIDNKHHNVFYALAVDKGELDSFNLIQGNTTTCLVVRIRQVLNSLKIDYSMGKKKFKISEVNYEGNKFIKFELIN